MISAREGKKREREKLEVKGENEKKHRYSKKTKLKENSKQRLVNTFIMSLANKKENGLSKKKKWV